MTTVGLEQPRPIDLMRHIQSRDELQHFGCGVREIDRWARDKAFKFHDRGRARVTLAFRHESLAPCGFYSLSMTMEVGQKLLSQGDRDIWQDRAPLVYIDYLAVSSKIQCVGLGSILLVHALKTAVNVQSQVPLYGVGLRSLNDRTTKLYQKYGFNIAPREDGPHPLMILPIWTAIDLFRT